MIKTLSDTVADITWDMVTGTSGIVYSSQFAMHKSYSIGENIKVWGNYLSQSPSCDPRNFGKLAEVVQSETGHITLVDEDKNIVIRKANFNKPGDVQRFESFIGKPLEFRRWNATKFGDIWFQDARPKVAPAVAPEVKQEPQTAELMATMLKLLEGMNKTQPSVDTESIVKSVRAQLEPEVQSIAKTVKENLSVASEKVTEAERANDRLLKENTEKDNKLQSEVEARKILSTQVKVLSNKLSQKTHRVNGGDIENRVARLKHVAGDNFEQMLGRKLAIVVKPGHAKEAGVRRIGLPLMNRSRIWLTILGYKCKNVFTVEFDSKTFDVALDVVNNEFAANTFMHPDMDAWNMAMKELYGADDTIQKSIVVEEGTLKAQMEMYQEITERFPELKVL